MICLYSTYNKPLLFHMMAVGVPPHGARSGSGGLSPCRFTLWAFWDLHNNRDLKLGGSKYCSPVKAMKRPAAALTSQKLPFPGVPKKRCEPLLYRSYKIYTDVKGKGWRAHLLVQTRTLILGILFCCLLSLRTHGRPTQESWKGVGGQWMEIRLQHESWFLWFLQSACSFVSIVCRVIWSWWYRKTHVRNYVGPAIYLTIPISMKFVRCWNRVRGWTKSFNGNMTLRSRGADLWKLCEHSFVSI